MIHQQRNHTSKQDIKRNLKKNKGIAKLDKGNWKRRKYRK